DRGGRGRRVQELDVGAPPGDGEGRGRDDLSRLKHRPAVADEELRGGDFPRCRVHRRAEGEAGGGIVAGRFVGRERAAQRAPVANGRVADVAHQGRQDGQVLPQNGRAGNFGVRRTRPDRDRAVTELDPLGNQAGNVYEAGRRGAAALHVAQQRLAAGEQHCTLLDRESARFVERGGAVVDKVTHAPSSLVRGGHRPGAGGDRLDDVVIARAAADVALE